MRKRTLEEAFNESHRKDCSGGCWNWTGYIDKRGMPLITGKYNGRQNLSPKRVSYLMHCGDISDKEIVKNTCNNNICVNPCHLTIASQAEHFQDMANIFWANKERSTLEDLFDGRYLKHSSGCWLWTGSISDIGYSRLNFRGNTLEGHRISYKRYKGEIPSGMHVDHLCMIKHCVNPDHLETVTPAVNKQRQCASKPKRIVCSSGHALDQENTYKTGKYDTCRKCRADYARKFRNQKKAERMGSL